MSMWGGERAQFAWSAAAVCLVGFCLTAPASAQSDAVQRKVSKSGKANQEVPLTGFSRLDNDCAGTGPPRINLDRAAAHCIVCFRPAEVQLKFLMKGTPSRCLDSKVTGVRVFYRPYPGYTGKDGVRFTAHFPKDQITLDFDLTIVPDDRPSLGEASPPAGASAEEAQKPGPMPVCSGLVS
jgi:hypothetical protein